MSRRPMLRRAFALTAVAAALVAAGCASDPLREPEAVPTDEWSRWMPGEFRNASSTEGLPRPPDAWWTEFGSAELDGLVDTALVNNHDVRIAIARVAQAEAQARIADAGRYATLDAVGRAEVRAPRLGVGTATSRDDWGERRIYQIGLRAAYEVDVWGRLGYASQSALELARASQYNREAVAVTLVSDVATTYIQLLALHDRERIAQRALDVARDIDTQLVKRVDIGDATMIQREQQAIAVSSAEGNLASLRLQRERAFDRLAFLVGRPSSKLEVKATGLGALKVPAISPGLPSDLVCRRPDVRRSEAQLASAQADVNAARAALLPSFSLVGETGYGSYRLADILSPQSLFYSVVGTVVQSLFDAGRRESQVDYQRARVKESVEAYAQTILAALRDVEDALAGVRYTGEQQAALARAASRSQRLLDMSRKVYDRGALDYLGLLDIQRSVYSAEDSELNARADRLRASIDLSKALAGSSSRQDPTPCGPAKPAAADGAPAGDDAAAKRWSGK